MVLRPVRFADGRLVRFRDDHVAMLLKIGEMVLLVGGVFWWLTGSFNRYVALMLIMSLVASFTASWRLRRAVRQIEEVRKNEEGRSQPRLKSGAVPFWERLNDWGIRHYSRKVEKLLALAEDADASGDESAAAKYRDRAAKHRSTVDKCRELKAGGIKPFG